MEKINFLAIANRARAESIHAYSTVVGEATGTQYQLLTQMTRHLTAVNVAGPAIELIFLDPEDRSTEVVRNF